MNNQELMNELMEKYDGNWIDICVKETLSESFIREFQDKVNWFWISMYQTLSEDFIREFKVYLE